MEINNPIQERLNESLNQGNKIMMQAVGAYLRGESPQTFLQNLARSCTELQEMDLNHPLQSAEKLYAQKGKDINAAKSSIMDKINAFIGLK